MTHRTRSAIGRFLALRSASALALIVAASPLAAQQTTGKIEGAVTDQQGGPVANAQVSIVGTSFGALTNERGYYFINNVPVGTHTLRARFIGYTAAEVTGVRVLGGQTITQNVKLTASAVAIGPVTVEAAANPMVPRDQVTSKSIIAGDLLASLPVDDARGVLRLTPGVVESEEAAGLSIRGGRPGETNVYIDGAPVRGTNGPLARAGQLDSRGATTDARRLGTHADLGALAPITVGTNAVEEASVTTGALGVEFSDAQSGVIALTTRAGGARLEGSVSAETDEPMARSVSRGFNRFQGSLGGPVPRVANLTWFASGVLQGQRSGNRAMGAADIPTFVFGGVDAIVPDTAADGTVTQVTLPRYVQYSGACGRLNASLPDTSALARDISGNYGFDCQGYRRPMDWETSLQLQGKLQYTYGSGSTVSLTGVSNGDQSRDFPGRDIGNPAAYRGRHFWRRMGVLNWNHQVTRTAERALSIQANASWQRDRFVEGPLDPASEVDTRDPTLGIQFKSLKFGGNLGVLPFPLTDEIIRNIRTNDGLRLPLLDRTDLAASQEFRLNPYGLATNSWFTFGLDESADMLAETRYTGRLVVDWQANRFHRFTLGGDVKKTDLSLWSSSLITQIFMNAYVAEPIQYGFFAADRLDLGDVVLELGARYDYYDSKTLFAKTPGFTFAHPDWNSQAISDNDPTTITDDTAYANSLARVFTPSRGHHTISPRLRVSFPITEKTGFRLSYAHQVQSPEFSTLLQGINSDLSFTNSNDVFGRDLDFGKTILFEFGVRHAFSRDMVLDISAYNKDKVSDFAARVVRVVNPGEVADTPGVNILTNRDFGNARGVEVKFDRRVGNYVNATAAYTFQVARNTGSDPFTYLNTFARTISAFGEFGRIPPAEQAQRTDDDRTHNFVGAIAMTFPSDWKKGTPLGEALRNVNAFLTFRVVSGLPYTRIRNNGDGQTAPHLDCGLGCRVEEGETLNNQVLPWTKMVDLRVNKGFRVGRFDWTVYADVRNLFNFRNTVGAFAETGDDVNSRHVENQVGRPDLGSGEFQNLWNEARAVPGGSVLNEATKAVNLRGSCSVWIKPVNCESLRRVEARFGDGDGIYTLAEQERVIDTYYNAQFGAWRFNGAPRQIRVGAEVNF
jgi:hypothetical protein